MNRIFFAFIFTMAGIIVSGCDGGLLTSSQRTASKLAVNRTDRPDESSNLLMVAVDSHD
jgi:hypothetical protein